MSQQEGSKTFYLSQVFFQAIKALDPKYLGTELQIQFLPPNRLKVHPWSDDKPACRIFKSNFDKALESINIMKLKQPEKKVQRIKMMKKWKNQFQIQALNIFTIKKNYGNVHYLMGCTSQLQLYQVLTNLQAHSYKTFSTTFVKFLYKPALQALINCEDYQISVYDKLKITSTELRFIQAQSKNQRKGKFIEMLFELEKYASTKELVDKYKEFLRSSFFVCGIVFDKEKKEDTKEIIYHSKPKAWKLIERKGEDLVCIYVIFKQKQTQENMASILNECTWIKYIKFLKGLGKGNQILQPLIGDCSIETLGQKQLYIQENFTIKGNSEKTPSEISLSLKKQDEHHKWNQALRYLI